MKRPTQILLVLLAAVLCASLPAGAYTLILKDGRPMSVKDFRVVGDMKPTGTPNDRAAFVNLEGFYHTL